MLSPNLEVSDAVVELTVGQTHQFAILHTQNGTEYQGSVAWSSSDPAIVSVDATGLATALSAGTALILASNSNGVKDDGSAQVNVAAPPQEEEQPPAEEPPKEKEPPIEEEFPPPEEEEKKPTP
jgi:uncharacterized protein YjdB